MCANQDKVVHLDNSRNKTLNDSSIEGVNKTMRSDRSIDHEKLQPTFQKQKKDASIEKELTIKESKEIMMNPNSDKNWYITIIGVFLAALTLLYIMLNDKIDTKYDAINTTIDSRFREIQTEFKSINQRFDSINQRFDYQEKLNSLQIQRDVQTELNKSAKKPN